VTLEVLLEHDALLTGLPSNDSDECACLLRRSPSCSSMGSDDLRVQVSTPPYAAVARLLEQNRRGMAGASRALWFPHRP